MIDIRVEKYRLLGSQFSTELRVYAVPYSPKPTVRDYQNGYLMRYFVRKANDIRSGVTEVSKSNFDKVGSYYKKLPVKWKITGPINDIIDRGIVVTSGVIDTNRRTVEKKAVIMPGLSKVLNNLLAFYKVE